MSELVRYEAACRAVAEAKSFDEVKDILDKSVALAAYARQAKNKQLEIDCSEIRFRAERRVGEMMSEQRETVGLAQGKRTDLGPARTQVDKASLSEAGIDKHLADRARKYAAIPEQKFESILSERRERIEQENERVTVNLLDEAKKHQKAERVEGRRVATAHSGCTVSELSRLIASGQRFGCIYADPPWLYDNQGTRAATSNHYDGMTVEDLCALPIRELAADDAHLHLWTTNGFLFECPKIFDAWGFEFRSSLVWVKPQIGIGNYWRNSHEFLLTAIRGDAKRFNDKSLKSWIECDRGAHSAKPEIVRHMIEKASPSPLLELFGRSAVDGWTVWGNQIERSMFHQGIPEFAA